MYSKNRLFTNFLACYTNLYIMPENNFCLKDNIFSKSLKIIFNCNLQQF